ncbi:DUF6268 family outer membrane beta-barrel protein [Gemmatimonadota bacterium]
MKSRLSFILTLTAVMLLYATGEMFCQARESAKEVARSNFEIFSLKNLYIPESDFEESSSALKGKFSINMLDAGLNVPTLFQDGKTAIVHSLSYQLLEFNRREALTGGVTAASSLDDLTAIEYQFLAMHSFSGGRWRWWFTSLHGIYSDRSGGLSLNDYRLQAALAMERTWESGAVFGLGLAYSSTFNFPVLPVLTLQTSPESALGLDLLLPFNGALVHRISPNAEIGLAGAIEGNRFNLRQMQGQNIPNEPDNLRYSVGTFGPRGKFRFAGPCYLVLDAGRTVRHRVEFYNGNSKTGEIELENNWFVRITFNVEL